MSKGWGRAAAVGVGVLLYMDAVSPGSGGKAIDQSTSTVNKAIDSGTGTASQHVIPGASEIVTATKDGVSELNILGPTDAAQAGG